MRAPVGIVLLAAGIGTRFGPSPKLLACLDGKPLVRHAAEAAVAAGLGPVVAVLGHAEAELRAALAGLDLCLVSNARYAEGLSTSLLAGLAALPEEVVGAIILLGDMPRVAPSLLRGLAAAFREAGEQPAAVVPARGGRRGNPVLLNRRVLAAGFAGLSGDRGAGPLLAGRPDVLEWEAVDAGVLLDVDTPEALAAAGRP
ncbi:nucleotidyltransferase family protein [Methylobacterium nodulans]|uniref:4-diphosphocytidyl-2C-methyl-D-erythritol synthase n=1 Tax=Methylobacterium nodulans (strain LMG 21967 / CNCM I-2342 / ORS 2060) TaxID=460265 RepID=B8IR45_METNO|nr:nucleotidyltransferase family protein [Methylobacterium nodulans]ACL56747.1 4-diphosphocytidyl-2C-methyl-D-erythritol synthase [Methylobacterium nodulans ORS 2060]